jgi:hypothetical protein
MVAVDPLDPLRRGDQRDEPDRRPQDGADLTAVRNALRAQKVNVSISPSEYTLIDMEARGLPSVARFCVALAGLLP